MEAKKTGKSKCTLSNKELIDKCWEWVKKLCDTGGSAWTLTVPPNFNKDPDLLFVELGKRLEKSDQFIGDGKEGGGWVSVEEKTPDAGTKVIGLHKYGSVADYTFGKTSESSDETIGKFWCLDGFFDYASQWVSTEVIEDNITHWMPLIIPPKPNVEK